MEKKKIAEFYNDIVSITKETGQGVPSFIAGMLGLEDEVNKMVEEGKLIIYTDKIEDMICIAGVYNVEKELQNDNYEPLGYLRRWLNIDQTEDVPFILFEDITPKEAYDKWAEETQDRYDKWVVENKESLDAITNLQLIEE